MIIGPLAILLNLISVLTLCGILVVAAVSVSTRFNLININRYSATSRRQILWLVAFSPWVIGLVAGFIALLSGSRFWPIPDSYSFLHWHHPQEFLLYSWHGLSVALAMGCTGIIVFRNLVRLVKNSNKLKTLLALAEIDGNGFYRLDADAPAAFTAGYSQPKCYITNALRAQLSDEEYSIIKLHEKEHARRHDPYQKWLFQLLTAFFPRRISQTLNQSMTTVMEQCADEAVSSVIADKSVIAMTLVKVRRLTIDPLGQKFAANLICHYGMDNIEPRIAYLLSDTKGKVFPLLITMLMFTAMSILCAMSADVFHHTIEYTLSHS